MGTQDMLTKVRALLDTADSLDVQGNSEAAAVYRAKALALRDKYNIEEEQLIAQDPQAVLPVLVPVVLTYIGSEFRQEYVNLFYVIARHAGVRVHYGWEYGGGIAKVVAQAVGYESDVRYAEMLFTNARLVFSERLEPAVKPGLSDQENVYRLRGAGMERVRVADLVFGNRDKGNLAKVGRMYKAECERRGEAAALSGRGVTGKAYREQYAQEFAWALDGRLRRAQDAAGQYGGGLVLHGRKERVDEAFYERFPQYRPTPALPAGECEKCKTTKHPSGKCKDCRPRPVTKKDVSEANRYHSPAAQRGREAGRTAAAHVQLTRAGKDSVEDGGRGTVERLVQELGG